VYVKALARTSKDLSASSHSFLLLLYLISVNISSLVGWSALLDAGADYSVASENFLPAAVAYLIVTARSLLGKR